MPDRLTLPLLSFLVLSGSFLNVSPLPAAEAGPSDQQLWAEAEARIEQHRKADATIVVTDADGKPASGAEVQVEQVRHAFLFGCNIFAWGRVGDEAGEAAYRERFADVFDFATLPFYWWSYEATRGQPIHERTEQVARWCREQRIVCKGHPLAWNYGEPRWLPDDSQQVLELQRGRITDCVTRFSGLIDIWDAVNEATHFDRADCSRQAPKLTAAWAAAGQDEFVRQCFQQARTANPTATLLINDYRVDPAYADLIEKLAGPDGKRLYDVIGIQSHQHGGVWSNRKIWETCERFARFGVPLHFTETTILSGKPGWELAQPARSGRRHRKAKRPRRARSNASTPCCTRTPPSQPLPGGTSATAPPGSVLRPGFCVATCRPNRPTTCCTAWSRTSGGPAPPSARTTREKPPSAEPSASTKSPSRPAGRRRIRNRWNSAVSRPIN